MHRPHLRLLLLALLAALALVATACGGDEAADTTETADPAADTAPDPTVDPADDGADMDEDTEDPDPTGQSGAAFCSVGVQAEEAGASFDPAAASAQEVETYFRSQLALVQEGVEVAPDEVVEAITVRRDALEETIALLEPLDWDLMGNFDAATAPFETDEFTAAVEELDRFAADACPPTEGDPDADPPQELTAAEEAYCAHSAEMGGREGVPEEGAPDEVSAYYDTVIADLDRALELASPDLAADYELVIGVFAEFYEIIETAGFDLDVAQPNLDAFQAKPGVDDPMSAAIANIEAYDAAVCGIT